MIESALNKLDQSPDRHHPEMKEIYDDVAGHYRQRLPEFGPRERHSDGHHRFEQISRRLRDEERAAAVLLRDQDRNQRRSSAQSAARTRPARRARERALNPPLPAAKPTPKSPNSPNPARE
jgi:predicted glycoside hydrolase/deacetylase ChbG (UPF0249 family)